MGVGGEAGVVVVVTVVVVTMPFDARETPCRQRRPGQSSRVSIALQGVVIAVVIVAAGGGGGEVVVVTVVVVPMPLDAPDTRCRRRRPGQSSRGVYDFVGVVL